MLAVAALCLLPASPAKANPGPWLGYYWNNQTMSGLCTGTRNDPDINFDWGSGGPGIAGVGADHFSARWVGSFYFEEGMYNFYTLTDDGVRLYIDNVLVQDYWTDHAATQYTNLQYIKEGGHTIQLEYYENAYDAVCKLWWEEVPPSSFANWKGEYFSNPTLSGNPTAYRDDAAINFEWQSQSPGVSGVPQDNFSVRWTRTLSFAAGTYKFHALTDDGCRLFVDGTEIIDNWNRQAATEKTATVTLTAGNHTVKLEYFEGTEWASAKLWWETAAPTTFVNWKGEYFSNPNLSGDPTAYRDDADINFYWGMDSPMAGIPGSNFSVRWTRTLSFAAGTYTFHTITDDGVRLYVDGTKIIDDWNNHPATENKATITLTAGNHTVKMEYFDNEGGDVARLWWVAAAPSAPTGLTAAAGNQQVQLTWTGVSGASGYNVYRNGGKVNSAALSATSYLDTGLTNGTTYTYQVAAIANGQESQKSASASATPQASSGGTTGGGTTGGGTTGGGEPRAGEPAPANPPVAGRLGASPN